MTQTDSYSYSRVAAFSGSGSLARDNAQELSAIRSVEELEIDFSKALNIMRGDLSIIQGEVCSLV